MQRRAWCASEQVAHRPNTGAHQRDRPASPTVQHLGTGRSGDTVGGYTVSGYTVSGYTISGYTVSGSGYTVSGYTVSGYTVSGTVHCAT